MIEDTRPIVAHVRDIDIDAGRFIIAGKKTLKFNDFRECYDMADVTDELVFMGHMKGLCFSLFDKNEAFAGEIIMLCNEDEFYIITRSLQLGEIYYINERLKSYHETGVVPEIKDE